MATFDINAAKQAGYSDQDIQAYMQQNKLTPYVPSQPPANPSSNNTNQNTSAAQGIGHFLYDTFVPGAVKDTISGFSNLASATGDTINYSLGDEKTKQQALQDYQKRYKELSDLQKKYGFSPIDSTNKNQFDPAKYTTQNAKGAAGVAAYTVPFGEGANLMTKAIIPGATSGAMTGISEDNATPESVLGSTVMGIAGGSILPAADAALSKSGNILNKAGTEIRGSVSKIQLPSSIYGAGREKAVQGTLDKLGISGSAQQKYEQLLPKYQQLSDYIDGQLMNSDKTANIDQIKNDFMKNLHDATITGNVDSKTAKKKVTEILKGIYNAPGENTPVPDDISAYDLFQMKKKLNGLLGKVYTKLQNGNPLTEQEQVILAGRNTLDDIISQLHPEVKDATTMQSHLYDAADSLGRSRNAKGQSVFGIPMPAPIIQGAADITGKTMQNAGKLSQGLGSVNNVVGNKSLSIGSTDLINSDVNNPGDNTQNPNGNINNDTNSNEINNQVGHTNNNNTSGNNNQDAIRAQYQNAIQWDLKNNGGRGVDTIKQMFQSAYPEAFKVLSPEQQQAKFNAESGLESLDNIQRILNQNGNQLTLSLLPDQPLTRDLEREMSNAADIIGKIRTGKNANQTERTAYYNMLPKIGDSQETINSKIDKLRKEFNNYVYNQNAPLNPSTP